MNWRIRVYNDDDSINCSWVIKNRSEHEADNEAMREVEQHFSGMDWSITEE